MCYKHDPDPLTSDFIPMSCQILCVPARLTWRWPTFHSSSAMMPVKHTAHKVFGLFLPWEPLWYSPDICAYNLLPTEGQKLAAVQVPEVFVSFVQSSSARKASFLQLYPLTGEIRSSSLFYATSKAVNQPTAVVRNREDLFGPKGNEERSLQSGEGLFSKIGPAEMMLSSYCDFSTSLSPTSIPKPKRGKCCGPPGYQRRAL